MIQQIGSDILEIAIPYLLPNLIITFIIIFFGYKMIKKIKTPISFGVFILYLLYFFEVTLLCRESGTHIGTNLEFFGTYGDSVQSKCYMIENILLFIPLGFFYHFKMIWPPVCFLALSLFIETTQLLTGRGYFQLDDIWLNVLGGFIGYVMLKIKNRLQTNIMQGASNQ